jgi:transcriptional regulator with XRE-family HTH domain
MQYRINFVGELGALVRAMRKDSKIRLDDLASVAGLSKQFVNDLELGKEGVQLGKVLQVLDELGLYVYVDSPKSLHQQLERSKALIARTNLRRSIRERKKGGRSMLGHDSGRKDAV